MEKQPNTLRIVGAMASQKNVVFHLEDGTQLTIKQGDHRLGDLMEKILPINTRGEVAVIDLQDFSVYTAFEQKSEGKTKFFKMAKDKVLGWFGGKTDTHEEIPKKERVKITEEGKEAILRAVRGEVMTEAHVVEHGTAMDASDSHNENEVVVAVITTPATATEPEKKTVIPGVQNLKPLIERAVRTNSPQAVQNFLNRCAAFIDKRAHTVDDLMRFLEKGDLPLAEDGSIIAYKMLKHWKGDRTQNVFVDCHTKSIKQRVGSYVCVNENLVDLNRRNECSSGLHIARRGYLSGFGGDVCVLCKIDPEDVMVVPHNDPNKVRVKGYHILGELPLEAVSHLKANKPMTGEEAALKMVYDAIKGNHIDRIERVQVNGQRGTNVMITSLKHDASKGPAHDHNQADLKKATALDAEGIEGINAVDPRDLNKRINEEHAKIKEETKLPEAKADTSPKAQMQTMLLDLDTSPTAIAKYEAATSILAFKRKLKKSWEFLGVSADKVTDIMSITDNPPMPVDKPKAGTKEKKAEPETVKPRGKEEVIPSTGSLTISDRGREMFNRKLFTDLRNLKKKAKKSWTALGFTAKEIAEIEKHV